MKRLAGFWALVLWAQLAAAGAVFGTVDAITGSATVTGQDGQPAALSVGMNVYEGDTVTSAHDGEVQIVTDDGGFIALRPDTVFRVDQYKADGGDDDKTFMSLLKGAVRSITGWIGKHNNAAYRLTTPTATVGIRGTYHEVTVVDPGTSDTPGTYDTVNEGSTVLTTPQGQVVATPGKFAFAPRGRAVAPFFLKAQPHFLAGRHLRLEGRIAARSTYLRGQLKQMRDQRVRDYQLRHGQRPGAGTMRPGAGNMLPGAAQRGAWRDRLRGEGRSGAGGLEGRGRYAEARRQRFGDRREAGARDNGGRREELRQREGAARGEGGARSREGSRRRRD
jgi:hypothetical protein